MKKAYIINDYDNQCATAVKLTEEQVKAIRWFIDITDINYGCELPDDCAIDLDAIT